MNADPNPNERVALVLEVLPDPQAKALGDRFARPGDYRLKLALKRLLRDFGLRCVSVHDARPAGNKAEDLTPTEVPHAA